MNPNILLISETGGILIAFLICFIAIPGIVIGICVPISVHRHKYMSFVELYSEAYWKVKEINSRYFFASIPNFDMSHTYDNNDFYPVVSCQDYLTYQLVRLDKKS